MKRLLLGLLLGLPIQAARPPATDAAVVTNTNLPTAASTNEPAKTTKEFLATTAVDPEKRALKPHDTLRFMIAEDPPVLSGLESTRVTISDGGEAMFPISRHAETYVKVSVEGKKLEDLRREVKALLDKDYYADCTVQLDLEQINRGGFQADAFGKVIFYGNGGLNTSIPIPDNKPLMLSEAVLQAGGGGNAFADLKNVRIHRINPETKVESTLTVDVNKILKEGARDGDKQLMDGDRIEVREKKFLFN